MVHGRKKVENHCSRVMLARSLTSTFPTLPVQSFEPLIALRTALAKTHVYQVTIAAQQVSLFLFAARKCR